MKSKNTIILGASSFKNAKIGMLVYVSALVLIMGRTVGLWATDGSADFLQPPAPSELTGAWIGFDHDRLRFCKLELNRDGTGLFSQMWKDGKPEVYFINKWTLDKANISMELTRLDKSADSYYLKGLTVVSTMDLDWGAKATEWKVNFAMFREEQFDQSRARLNEQMNKFRKKAAESKK